MGAQRVLAAAAVLLCACEREERQFHTKAPSSEVIQTLRMSELQPGTPLPSPGVRNGYEENAYALSEGKTLFESFNCVGCHAHGGGAIGPPLMDDRWRYGGDAAQVYATILQGRPNGMPSFAGKVTEDQAWKLAAYVRSMSGLASMDASPGRDDHMNVKPPENTIEAQPPKNATAEPQGGHP